MAENITVEICMGSSCFARGNSENLQAIEAYLTENGLEDRVELIGHLCLGMCKEGPNLRIAGKDYSGIGPNCVVDVLKAELEA